MPPIPGNRTLPNYFYSAVRSCILRILHKDNKELLIYRKITDTDWHMAAQVTEAWKQIWRKSRQGRQQKHRRILESMKGTALREYVEGLGRKIQIRFT